MSSAPARSSRVVAAGRGPGVFLAALGLYLLCTPSVRFHVDGLERYALTQAMVERGSLAIGARRDGSPHYCRYGPLQSLLAIPFYVTGRLAAAAGAAGPLGDPAFYCNLHNAFITAAACWVLLWVVLDLGFSVGSALAAVAAHGLATGAWPNARWYGNEPLAGLLLLLSVALLARAGREGLSRRDAVGLGLAGGLAALNRPMVVPLIVVLSLAVGWRAWQAASGAEARRAWRLAGALMLLGLATALAYNAVAFGSPFRTGYEGDHGFQTFPYSGEPGFSTPLLVGLYGNLFSAGRSVFLYSPAALVAVFGLGRLWRTRPDYARPAVVAVAYYLLVWSKWWSWYGGAGLGNRALLPAVLLLMPAVAAVWDAAAGWRDGRRLATLAVILVGALVQTPSVLLSCGDVYSAVEGFDPRTYRNEYRIHYVPHTSPLAVGARLLIERGLQDNDLFLARWAPAEKEGAVVTALFGAVMAAGLGLAIRTARRASATPRGQPPRPGDTRGG